jgi:uncharacterized protein YfaA (DUF2138 family)
MVLYIFISEIQDLLLRMLWILDMNRSGLVKALQSTFLVVKSGLQLRSSSCSHRSSLPVLLCKMSRVEKGIETPAHVFDFEVRYINVI